MSYHTKLRSPVGVFFLAMITGGIYYAYWFYKINEEAAILSGDENAHPGLFAARLDARDPADRAVLLDALDDRDTGRPCLGPVDPLACEADLRDRPSAVRGAFLHVVAAGEDEQGRPDSADSSDGSGDQLRGTGTVQSPCCLSSSAHVCDVKWNRPLTPQDTPQLFSAVTRSVAGS